MSPEEQQRINRRTGFVIFGLILTVALVFITVSLVKSSTEERDREIRICIMNETLGGAGPLEAELVCSRER